MPKRADQRYLIHVAYADDCGFNARLSLYDHQVPRIDLVAEVMAGLGDLHGRIAVDAGCGTGQYLGALGSAGASVVVGVDLSVGMLRSARPRSDAALVAADAGRMPMADHSADVVLLLHMLYHLPRPADGVDEAARVVRQDGAVVVATNGADHLKEINDIWVPLLDGAGVLGDVEDVGLVNPRLDGDAAKALLQERFGTVREQRLRSTVIVTDPDPILAHAASTTAGRSVDPSLLDGLRDQIAHVISVDETFRVTTDVALFHATHPR